MKHARAVLLLARAACLWGCAGGAPSGAASAAAGGDSSTTALGARAPDFSARTIDGSTFHLGAHVGKRTLLLDFWATFCQPCLAEFPHLRRLQAQYEPDGLLVVAISMDGPETLSDVPAFASRNQVTFPVVLDEDSRIAALYNPRKSAPLTVLIGRDGRVARVRDGFNPGDEVMLERDIREVLGKP
jgi:peroxiredoxin